MQSIVKFYDQKVDRLMIAKLALTGQTLSFKVPVRGSPIRLILCDEYVATPDCTNFAVAIGWRCIEWLRVYPSFVAIARKTPNQEFRVAFPSEELLAEFLKILIEGNAIRVVKPEEIRFCLSARKLASISQTFSLVGKRLPTFFINNYDGDARCDERRIVKVVRWLCNEHNSLLRRISE